MSSHLMIKTFEESFASHRFTCLNSNAAVKIKKNNSFRGNYSAKVNHDSHEFAEIN